MGDKRGDYAVFFCYGQSVADKWGGSTWVLPCLLTRADSRSGWFLGTWFWLVIYLAVCLAGRMGLDGLDFGYGGLSVRPTVVEKGREISIMMNTQISMAI